ncbi:MAG TPA: hypothetical protein VNN15_03245 [Solirubrobacterales bacterium]|nr:hypothetical protein [Solirubrobacterales bacterium]
MTAPLHVLSLGAGVQSTTVALMATAGELEPVPDCAIFADTGEEPAAVYRHLDWLMAPGRLAFPVHVVRAWEGHGKPGIKRRLGDEIPAATRGEGKAGSHSRPPFFVANPDGTKGMIRRQCTGDFKIDVIQAKERELLGLKRGQRWPNEIRIIQWIGISTDEATRMKPVMTRRVVNGQPVAVPHPTIEGRWPLIERRMSRHDCTLWLTRRGFPIPPKSACGLCPFHSDAEWRAVKADPEAWARAVEIDRAIRTGLVSKHLKGALYLHASLKPLEDVDLSGGSQRDLFQNECEGMCGV